MMQRLHALLQCSRRQTAHFGRSTRASVAVETALALPILISVGLLGADLQRIQTERIRLENAAGAMALNLAAQPTLSAAGLAALGAAAMQGHEAGQQLIVLHVRPSGRINWALQRGGARDLCDALSLQGQYAGTLPERPAEDATASSDSSERSMVVVRACRSTDEILLTSGLAMPSTLDTTAIYRSTAADIELDDTLQAESDASGLAYQEQGR